MNTGLIIAAGGRGKRFGNIYKPLLKIKSKTLLEITIARFLKLRNITIIVVAVPKEYIRKAKKVIDFVPSNRICSVIEGGKERKYSVYNAFKELSKYKNIDSVIVHDAVRPVFSIPLLKLMLEKIKYCNAIIPVKPISETVKLVENSYIKSTLDRNKLYLSLTPQLFKKNILEYAYERINIDKYKITDEAQLVEMAGKKVKTIITPEYNIKITYPHDYSIIKCLLK